MKSLHILYGHTAEVSTVAISVELDMAVTGAKVSDNSLLLMLVSMLVLMLVLIQLMCLCLTPVFVTDFC